MVWQARRLGTATLAFFTGPQSKRRPMAALTTQAERDAGGGLLPKIFESALAVVPPDAAWPPLQRARTEARDAGLIRWPPHANVLYPFPPPKQFDMLGPLLEEALADLPAFEVTLAEFDSFDRPDSSVLFLRPTAAWVGGAGGSAGFEGCDDDPFQELYRRVRCAVDPHCRPDPPKKLSQPFVPHFTVTHTAGAAESAAARDALLQWWEPVRFTVREVHLISRRGANAPFELKWRVPLGGGDGVEGEAAGGADARSRSRSSGSDNGGGGGSEETGGGGGEVEQQKAARGPVSAEEAAYPLMVNEEDVDWAVEV